MSEATKDKLDAGWLYVRFHADEKDYRPVGWPPPGPYWCSGYGGGYSIVVAYVRTLKEVRAFWPEASRIDVLEDGAPITFSERFSEPEWWRALTADG